MALSQITSRRRAAGRAAAAAPPTAQLRPRAVACRAQQPQPQPGLPQPQPQRSPINRREIFLASVNVPVIASLLSIGAAPRPSNIGIKDYGSVQTLNLCPPTPNCIATSEEANDPTHYVPAWTYNPEDGRGMKKPATQQQAMQELLSVVETLKPDGFEPKIIKKTDDYVYLEYTSPTFGFIDDVEFWFRPGKGTRVEYRSASRIGESDGDVNRKRIRAIRQELEKKGWRSVGF